MSSQSIAEFLRLYGRLFEKGEDGALLGIPDGMVLRVNAAACRLLGCSEAEFLAKGRGGFLVDDADSRAFIAARTRDGFARGSFRMRRADGTTLPVEATSWILPVPEGRDFALVIFRDLTTAERAAQDAIDKRNEFAALTRASLDGYVLVGEGDRILDVNEAACLLYGYSRDEMLRLGIRDIDATMDAATVQARLDQITRQGWDRFVARNRRKDGQILDVEISIFGVPTAGGRLVCIVRDISERLRAEERLRASEERHRRVLENSRDITFNCAPDGRVTYVSASVDHLLGFSPADLMSRSLGEARLLAPDSVALLARYLAEVGAACAAKRTPDGLHADLEYRARDGSMKTVEVRAFPILRMDGSLSEFLGVGRDVTEERRTAEALRKSEALLRAIADSTPDSIFAKDREGRWTFANAAVLAATGKPAAEVLGHTDLEITGDPECARTFGENDRKVEEGDAPLLFDEVLATPSGPRRFLSTKAPLRDGEGRTIGVVGVARDVTELRRLEQRLALTSRLAAMGTLVAGVAHEVNNPLTALTAGVGSSLEELRELRRRQGLGDRVPEDELARRIDEVMEQLGEATDASARVARIVKDLSVFGGRHEERGRLRLRDVVEGANRWFQKAPVARASVRIVDERAPDVLASRGLLEQIVLNLLTNAARAALPGRTTNVLVRLAAGGPGHARIQVTDDGTGIEPAILDRIFDPFYTTRPAGEGRGTGMGLAICHAIVDAYDGTISVASELGKGSTFTVDLPAAPGSPLTAGSSRGR